MKGREVYDTLKTRGVDPEVLKILVTLAEDTHAIQKALSEMAKSFDAFTGVLSQHTLILDGMQGHIKLLKKRTNDVRSLGTDEG